MEGFVLRIATVKKLIPSVNPFGSNHGNIENGQKWSLTPLIFFDFRHFINFYKSWPILPGGVANERS